MVAHLVSVSIPTVSGGNVVSSASTLFISFDLFFVKGEPVTFKGDIWL